MLVPVLLTVILQQSSRCRRKDQRRCLGAGLRSGWWGWGVCEAPRRSASRSSFRASSKHSDWNLASVNRHLRKITWDYYDLCLDLAAELGRKGDDLSLGYPRLGLQAAGSRYVGSTATSPSM